MSEPEILRILEEYSNIFTLDTIFARIIRELLWGIIKVLGYIVDSISAITDKLFVLDKFYNDPGVIDFINSVKPLIAVLFALSLLGIGYQLMFSKTKEFRKIGTNVLVAIAVLLVLPMAMNKMNELTNLGVTAVKGNPPDLTNQIIKSNILDLIAYDKMDFNKEKIEELENPNEIDVNKIRNIDATTIIEPTFFNSIGLKNEKIFTNKIVLGEAAEFETGELNQGWFKFWEEYYYRFSINFLNIIVSLSVVGATLAFTCFKLARLIFELGYNKFLAIVIAPADIADGQKTKQILQNIMSTFIVTFFIAVLLKFYVLFVAICAKTTGIEGVILLVAGSFAVIDGPNLVEKLFGIDAGLQSGFKTMAGAYMIGKTAMGGAKSIGNTAKSMAGGAGKMAGGAIGASAGIASGLKQPSLHEDMAKDKEKKNENANANKAKSIYPGMEKEKAKANENLGKENGSIANTGNSNKNDDSSPEAHNNKGNDERHQSIYDAMGNGKNNINENSKGHKSIYDEMNESNRENGISGHIRPKPIDSNSNRNGQPSSNNIPSNNTPEPINSSSNGGNEGNGHIAPNNTPESIQSAPSSNGNGLGGQSSSNNISSNNTPEPINNSSSNGSNEGNGHITPNNTPEPIQSNNDNSSYQTIGQHQTEKIVNKFQNNPIVKQTRESYNRGKNTGQSIRDNRNK